jgi:hypothetical protein
MAKKHRIYRVFVGDDCVGAAIDLVDRRIDKNYDKYTFYDFEKPIYDFCDHDGWIETESWNDAEHLSTVCYYSDVTYRMVSD